MISWIRRATWRDWSRLIKRALPHLAIIMAGMLVVFFVIDRFNKHMSFMTNEFHKVLTFVLCLLTIDFAIQICSMQRRAERSAYQRQLRARAKQGAAAPSQRTPQPRPQTASQRPAAQRPAAQTTPSRRPVSGSARSAASPSPRRAETGVRVTSRTGQGYRTRQ